MKTSESIKNLTKALLSAQAQMGAAAKGAKNPFFKSSYADLPTVMEVVKGPLNEAGIVVLQPATNRDGKNFIETTLIHAETGEFITSDTEVITAKQNDPQSFGAAQTYARRFGLQAMLFIPAEDDDGNTAAGRTTTAKSAYTALTKPAVVASVSPKTDAVSLAQAAAAPATTNEVLKDETPIGSNNAEVKPLVKSSFRKSAKATTPVVAAATASESGWDS